MLPGRVPASRAGRAPAREFQPVLEIGVAEFSQKLLLASDDAEFQRFDFFARTANDVMMVRAFAPQDHFIVSHIVGKITFLDDSKLHKDGQRPVDRDEINVGLSSQELLKPACGKRLLLLQDGLEKNAPSSRQAVVGLLDEPQRFGQKAIGFCMRNRFFALLHA